MVFSVAILNGSQLGWQCNFDVVFCDWAIWKNRWIFKFSSEYGPSIKKKKKYTNKLLCANEQATDKIESNDTRCYLFYLFIF